MSPCSGFRLPIQVPAHCPFGWGYLDAIPNLASSSYWSVRQTYDHKGIHSHPDQR